MKSSAPSSSFQRGRRIWPVLVCCASACGAGENTTTEPDPGTPAASVDLAPDGTSLASLGAEVQLTATARDAAGNVLSGKTITWSSDATAVASVTSSGLVTALANGAAGITAETDGIETTASIDVRQVVAGLAVTVQPSGAFVAGAMRPAVEVASQDALGHSIADGTDPITLNLDNDPVGGSLTGTVVSNGVNGVAGFDDVSVDRPGLGFTLVASSASVSSAPSDPFDVTGFLGMAAGSIYTCATATDGATYCWGGNGGGRLGDGGQTDRSLPGPVTGGHPFNVVDAARDHACAVTTDGAAYCWGLNHHGQLGDGSTDHQLEPVPVSGGLTFTSISAGWEHTCAVTVMNDVYCWGDNAHSQLGDGGATNALTPVLVQGGHDFASVTAGREHSCAVTGVGEAYCWGDGGRIGDGTGLNAVLPVPVAGGHSFETLDTGGFHTCGVTTDGAGYCWGTGGDGQLGGGTMAGSLIPVLVTGGHTWSDLSTGCAFTCGVTANGVGHCWGFNLNRQLGQPDSPVRVATPTPIAGGLDLATIDLGCTHGCAITTGGGGCCWGDGGEGRLGDGREASSSIPVRVGG